MTTARLEAFSDGVIAIAVTLLVLEIRPPELAAGESLWPALGNLWPAYASYAVSFLTIGIMWVNHHGMFHLVRSVDRGLLYWNLFLLGTIGVLPFTTGVLSDHLAGGAAGRSAAVVYAGSYAIVGVAFNGLWWHLGRHPSLLAAGIDPATPRRALRQSIGGPVLYVGAAGLGAWSPAGALALCGSLAVYFATTGGSPTPDGQ